MGRMEFIETSYYEVRTVLGNGKFHFQKIVNLKMEFKGLSIVFTDEENEIIYIFPANNTIVNLVKK